MNDTVAVLTGGLDSAILCADLARGHRRVHPVYIRQGLLWEETELAGLRRFFAAIDRPALAPLTTLDLPVADIYGEHWSLTGREVPGDETPDEAVYLPGRNLLLLAKVAVLCSRLKLDAIALGTLSCNPFPDNTDEFYASMSDVIHRATGHRVAILRPFSGLSKAEAIRRGADLPLHLALSCLQPVDGAHCGRCNKCAERRAGFLEARVTDRTVYANEERAARAV